MSKIEELRAKYPKITQSTFDKLVDGDKTPTKKYAEYMVKMWARKNEGHSYISSTSKLIEEVSDFDSLLPYIEVKDIYNQIYLNYDKLRVINETARNAKDEKNFVREDHIIVLEETEDYLFLIPKTHRGSLKYGANTKWCTASRNNESTFRNYKNRGCLAYLIDKTNKRGHNLAKVAFYMSKENALFSDIDVFNMADTNVRDTHLISGGWKFDELTRINFIFRSFAHEWEKTRKARIEVEKVAAVLYSIDFESLKKSMSVLETSLDFSYVSNAKDIIDSFVNKLKILENGNTKTKN